RRLGPRLPRGAGRGGERPHVVPAVGHTALAARRGAGPDARATRLWLAALVLIGGVCAAMVAGAVVAVRTPAALHAAGAGALAAYWAVLLHLRVRRAGRAARTVGRIAVGLAVLGLADAVAQTAQGVRGFDLRSAPLLALHALCMGLLLLVPLHLPPAAAAGLG